MKNHIIKLVIRHNLVNFFGFGVVAVLNIALIPVIISRFGIDHFGMLAMVRYMLPTGILGILDLGIPETIIRHVAFSRGKSSGKLEKSIISFGMVSLAAIGIIVSLLFYIITSVSNLITSRYLADVLPVLSLTIMFMYIGFAIESVIKGMELFSIIRLCEIARSALYFIIVIMVIYMDIDFIYVIYALLYTYWIQYLLYLFIYMRYGNGFNLHRIYFSEEIKSYIAYARTILVGKIISNLMTNLPAFIIAPMGGLKAVGIYEALVRLPKYTKTVLSIINASVMPVSARLRGEGDKLSERSLLINGTVLTSFVFLPVLICVIAMSDLILKIWLGEELEPYGIWLGLMFLLPFMTNYLTVGKSMLVVHRSELKKINNIGFLQLIVFSVVGIIFVNRIPEAAFILGIVCAQAIALPIQIKIISKFFNVSIIILLKPLLWIVVTALIPLTILLFLKSHVSGVISLIWLSISYVCIHWMIIFLTYFNNQRRRQVFSLLKLKKNV